MRYKKKAIVAAVSLLLGTAVALPGYAKHSDSKKEITIIHMGDLHGHTIPRPNLRSDGDGRMEGGLARMYTVIKDIRDDQDGDGNSLLINTGDTTQGSGEALYTEGQALLDVIDMFGVDAFAPGNWEYVYGPERFKAEFGNGTGKKGIGNRWGALASNLYNTAPTDDNGDIAGTTSTLFPRGKIPATLDRVHTSEQYNEWHEWYVNNGQRILPPYAIKKVGNVNVGIVGCTTRRGPQVVGKWVVAGIEFSDCAKEVPKFVAEVRAQGVDLVVLITEIEVGANIQMVSTFDSLDGDNHIDLILNSDMHEETVRPIEIPNKSGTATTLLIEEGQDGTMIGEIELTISNKKVVDWQFTPHRIHDGIREDRSIARKVAQVRAPFTTAFDDNIPCNDASPYWSKLNESCLIGSLDEVVGTTQKALHRSGYTDEALYSDDPDAMPAAIEGSSHDWIADAIRWWAKSDLATVRGFRYGTHIKPGPITRNDLYHFVPIAARVGKAGKIHANQLRNQVDNSSLSVFSTNPLDTNVKAAPYNNEGWAGGWMFAYSGPTLKFDPYWVRRGPQGTYSGDSRSRAITVTLPCDLLPSVALTKDDPTNSGTLVSEKTACEHSGAGSAITMINNDDTSENPMVAGQPGAWTTAWAQQVIPSGNAYWDMAIDEKTGVWSSTNGPAGHNKENHRPVMAVAGYYFSRAPYTLNNCPNCNPRGYEAVVAGAAEMGPGVPYLLPVNMDPTTGRAMLDDNGRPVFERDPLTSAIVWTRDEEGNPVAPVVAGKPIDLTVVLEKYLQEPGFEDADATAYDTERGRGPANPTAHRVTVLKPLPGREVFGGVPMMQPLCGVVASYFSQPSWTTQERIMAPIPECPIPKP
ncbi:bifunctional metallophosphatase/5'-nucleotidase [Kaarinaea lacus]